MFISMLALRVRVIVLVIVIAGTGWLAFWQTPGLDEVKNRWHYRLFIWTGYSTVTLFVLTEVLRLFLVSR